MVTFLAGLLILVLGAAAYGRVCERVFAPDDRKTPAVRLSDGVDFVPMKQWKNCLIQLLNIAGTGPIFGGILLLSALGVSAGIFIKGYPLDEIWEIGIRNVHPQGLHFVPVFFVTVACGIHEKERETVWDVVAAGNVLYVCGEQFYPQCPDWVWAAMDGQLYPGGSIVHVVCGRGYVLWKEISMIPVSESYARGYKRKDGK